MAKTKQIKVSDLVLDYNLYPRTETSKVHISQMAEALEAGVKFPPIIVDAKSLRVVDGFHRVEAYKRLKRETIEAELREYPSEAELFAEAARLNASHGRPLSPYDRKRIVLRLKELGFERERIAEIIQARVETVDQILRDTALYKGNAVPVKRGLETLKRKKITEPQKRLVEKWGGMSPLFYVNQVIAYLEADAWDPNNRKFAERMDYLCDLWMQVRGQTKEAA